MDYRVEVFNMVFEGNFDRAYQYVDCLDDLADNDIHLMLYTGEYLKAINESDNEKMKEVLDKIHLLAINGHDVAMFYYGLFAGHDYNDDSAYSMMEEAITKMQERPYLDFYRNNAMGYYYQILCGDIKSAIPFYEESANDGCFEALFVLADLYELGIGVKKSPKKSFMYNLKAAKLGLTSSMVAIAEMYKDGLGTPKNKVEAYKWIKRAARLKYPLAIYDLGVSYNIGEFGIKNQDKAFKLFKEAASLGIASAMHNVANSYAAKKQYKKAFNWYLEAARNDVAESMFAVASFYEEGIGCKKNIKEALFWYNEASEHGLLMAKDLYECLSDEINYGSEVAFINMHKREAAKGSSSAMRFLADYYHNKGNYEETFKWTEKASNSGDSTAQYNLGRLYETGRGVNLDYEMALGLYERSLAKKNIFAAIRLGNIYYEGIIKDKDPYKAISYFKMARDWGSKDAPYNLGLICEEDLHLDDEAYYWYLEAAKKGQSDAQNRLGEILIKKNEITDAIDFFTKSARRGCPKALYNIGLCYESGLGKEKSAEEARKYFNKAYKKGFKEALEHIKKDVE